MPRTAEQTERANGLDLMIRESGSDFSELALDDLGDSYARWYARLLSSLTLLVGDDDVPFTQVIVDGTSVTITIFTTSFVIRCLVPDTRSTTNPTVTAIPRSRLRSLSVSTTMPIDEPTSRAVSWPGTMSLRAIYEGSADPIDVHGPTFDGYQPNNEGRITSLFDALRDELRPSRPVL